MKDNIKKVYDKTLKKITEFFTKDDNTARKEKSDVIESDDNISLWQEGDRVELTLRYLNTTDPTSIDWTGDNKVADNNSRYISAQLGYRVVMFTATDYLPVGSVTITYNSILDGGLGKPTVPEGSHFREKSWDPTTGILVLENVYELSPGSSGFINLLYNVKGRDIISNETGILSDNNITARVDITIDGEVIYTETTELLEFKIELVKDEFTITKTAEQSINTVSNDPDIDNPDNFYWVDYIVDTSSIYHSRELEKGQIIDILPKDAILVSVADFYTRDILYNSYSTPPELVSYVNYESDPTGSTGGKITYSFDRNNPKLINLNTSLFKFIVKLKFPLDVEEKVKINNSEIQGYFEGEEEDYKILDTASASFTLETTGFANWDGNDIYSIRKSSTASENPHVVNATALQYGDWKTNYWNDYYYYFTKSKTTQPIDMVITDDLMYHYNNNGFVHMEETEYKFNSITLYRATPGINTNYEIYVRYEGRPLDEFEFYRSGTITSESGIPIRFSDNILPVMAFKVIYKDITQIITNKLVFGSNIVLKQTDAYVREDSPRLVDSSSRLVNYASLDVFRDGESILTLSSTDYINYMRAGGFTDEEIAFVSSHDLENYGHYVFRTKAQILIELKCYRPYLTKGTGVISYNSSERLYMVYWDVAVEARWSDLLQEYTVVDILPEFFSLRNVQRLSLDSRYPINYDVSTDDNYKNSGRQRVMIKVTSPDNNPDQIINYLSFRIYAYIDDISKFIPSSTVRNYVALVSKDIPYPSPDIRVGGTYVTARRDDGSYFNSIDPDLVDLWYDADSNRGADDYAWYNSNTVTIPQNPDAGRSGVEKYVKTNLNPYYSRVGSKSSLGSKFEYSLAINNQEIDIRDIIVYDTLPFIGDRFHETSGGLIVPRGSEWNPIFDSIRVEAPDGNEYPVYCTESYEPGELETEPNWMEISEFFASGKTPEDVKSIAVDFRGYTLLQGDYIRIYVTMYVPVDFELQDKKAVNTFYYTFLEPDGTTISGESNAVEATIFSPIATIGDTLFFDKNNNSIYEPNIGETGIGGATVQLYIEVDEEDDDTIIYNGHILKLVDSTTTSSTGTYSFKTNVSGVYFVKFINPNSSIYGAFSKKMENHNESIQISQVDSNGFTDSIIIDFEASGDTDINYPFADAGLIPAMGEYNFEKISDVPEGEYVELGSDTTFSIYDVENKSSDFALENFAVEDVPHKALAFKSITIPAYENAEDVKYTVKYKLASSGTIQVVPFGENLSANESHKVDFLVSVQPGDHVDNIYVEFGTVPAGFKSVNSEPIVIEFTLSEDINMFDDMSDDPEHKTADNTAYLKFMVNDEEITYEDNDNIIVPVPEPPEEGFKKESDVPKGEYVTVGNNTTFSIYEVENKNEQYALENFTLEDVPHIGLRFKSITIPAYENAEDVKYTIKYKLASESAIEILPGGEDLNANESHKVDFTVPIRWYDHVDNIYVEFGTVPVGFKPVNGAPIVIEFTLSKYMEDFDYLPGSSDKMADNTAYLKYILNGEEIELEDSDYVLVKDRCCKPCQKKPCKKKPC